MCFSLYSSCFTVTTFNDLCKWVAENQCPQFSPDCLSIVCVIWQDIARMGSTVFSQAIGQWKYNPRVQCPVISHSHPLNDVFILYLPLNDVFVVYFSKNYVINILQSFFIIAMEYRDAMMLSCRQRLLFHQYWNSEINVAVSSETCDWYKVTQSQLIIQHCICLQESLWLLLLK